MKVKSESEVAQSCLTLSDPVANSVNINNGHLSVLLPVLLFEIE